MDKETKELLGGIMGMLNKILSGIVTQMDKNPIPNPTPEIRAGEAKVRQAVSMFEELSKQQLGEEKVEEAKAQPIEKPKNVANGSAWTELEREVVAYCCNPNAPKSHRTLSYLSSRLQRSDSQIRGYLKRKGYRIQKGVIYAREH